MDELNEILIKASKDPMHRPEFYRMLLESNIYFLTNDVADPGVYRTNTDTSVSMLMMKKSTGEMICPVFTSVERIREAYPNSTYRFVGINARTFFNGFSGAPLILNPGCEVSKELLMSEVQSLLDGSLFNDNVVRVPKGAN